MIKKISIDGMSCGHCVRHVENALNELDGVKTVQVDLKGKCATVELTKPIEHQLLISAIEDAGYHVNKIEG